MKKTVLVVLTLLNLAFIVLFRIYVEYKVSFLGFAIICIVLEVAYYLWYWISKAALPSDDDYYDFTHDEEYETLSSYMNQNQWPLLSKLEKYVHAYMTPYYEKSDVSLIDDRLSALTINDYDYLKAVAFRLFVIDYVFSVYSPSLVTIKLKELPQVDLMIARELLGEKILAIELEIKRRVVEQSNQYYETINNNPMATQAIELLTNSFSGVTNQYCYNYIQFSAFKFGRNRYYDTQNGGKNTPVLNNIVSDVVGKLVAGNTPPEEVQAKALPIIQKAYEDTMKTKPMHAKEFRALQVKLLETCNQYYRGLTSWLISYMEATGRMPEEPVRVLVEEGEVVSLVFMEDEDFTTVPLKDYLLQCRVRLGIRYRKLSHEAIDKLCEEVGPDVAEMFRKGMLNEYLLTSYATYKPITLTVAMSKLLINELKQIEDVRTVPRKRSRKA